MFIDRGVFLFCGGALLGGALVFALFLWAYLSEKRREKR
jgi:hypothetical protein